MVSGFTQLLAERYRDALDERGREYVDFAQQGAARLRQLIAGLLAYSRVRTRGKPLAPVDAGPCLDGALRRLAAAARDRDSGAVVEHDVHARVLADDEQLGLVFEHLVANAIEFRRDEPPRISITARRDGPRWLFAVRDNGIGIPPEHAARVFEIFERLHPREAHPGAGVGLAVCRRIIERHEGTLSLQSDGRTGSTFSFTLRAAQP
jgi:light-regulated signal transduction histidine kinase (bacteriophytochrome)